MRQWRLGEELTRDRGIALESVSDGKVCLSADGVRSSVGAVQDTKIRKELVLHKRESRCDELRRLLAVFKMLSLQYRMHLVLCTVGDGRLRWGNSG